MPSIPRSWEAISVLWRCWILWLTCSLLNTAREAQKGTGRESSTPDVSNTVCYRVEHAWHPCGWLIYFRTHWRGSTLSVNIWVYSIPQKRNYPPPPTSRCSDQMTPYTVHTLYTHCTHRTHRTLYTPYTPYTVCSWAGARTWNAVHSKSSPSVSLDNKKMFKFINNPVENHQN